jgi:hypothetical protein
MNISLSERAGEFVLDTYWVVTEKWEYVDQAYANWSELSMKFNVFLSVCVFSVPSKQSL